MGLYLLFVLKILNVKVIRIGINVLGISKARVEDVGEKLTSRSLAFICLVLYYCYLDFSFFLVRGIRGGRRIGFGGLEYCFLGLFF